MAGRRRRGCARRAATPSRRRRCGVPAPSSRCRCRGRRGGDRCRRTRGRPAGARSSGTWGSMPYCAAAKWGSDTPAWAHAHMVRPEQSKARPGEAAAKRYGTPSWLRAARTAVAAPGEVSGMSIWGGRRPWSRRRRRRPCRLRRRSRRRWSCGSAATAAAGRSGRGGGLRCARCWDGEERGLGLLLGRLGLAGRLGRATLLLLHHQGVQLTLDLHQSLLLLGLGRLSGLLALLGDVGQLRLLLRAWCRGAASGDRHPR